MNRVFGDRSMKTDPASYRMVSGILANTDQEWIVHPGVFSAPLLHDSIREYPPVSSRNQSTMRLQKPAILNGDPALWSIARRVSRGHSFAKRQEPVVQALERFNVRRLGPARFLPVDVTAA